MDLRGGQADLPNATDDRIEQRSGLARPTGEGRTVDIDPLGGHHLGLAVKRQVVIELVHDHMGKRGKAGSATRDRFCRGHCLDDLLTGPAGILRANGADDTPLHRRHVEHLVAVLPKRTKGSAAIRAGTAACFRFDPAFGARQMRRKTADRGSAHGRSWRVFTGLYDLGFAFQFLQRQFELLDLAGKLLGGRAEAHPPELGKLETERLDQRVAGRKSRFQLSDPGVLVGVRGSLLWHFHPLANQGAQCQENCANPPLLSRQKRCCGTFGAAPVNAFQQHRKLRRSEAHLAGLRHRPYEAAAIHPLGKQAQALAVVPQQLDQIAALAAKGKQGAGMRALLQHLLRQHRQTVEAFAHIGRTASEINACRWR